MDKLTILTMALGFMPRDVGARQHQEAGHFARLMAMGVAFYTVAMGAVAMISLIIHVNNHVGGRWQTFCVML